MQVTGTGGIALKHIKISALLLVLTLSVVAASDCLAGELKDLDKDYWMGIYTSGVKVGYRHDKVTRDSLNGTSVYRYEQTFSIKYKKAGIESIQAVTDTTYVDSGFYPLRTSVKLSVQETSSGSTERIDATYELTYQTTTVEIKTNANGESMTQTLSIPDPDGLSRYWAYRMGERKLSIGQELRCSRMSWVDGEIAPYTVSCVGKSIVRTQNKSYDCLRLVEKHDQGADYIVWMLPDGMNIKFKYPDESQVYLVEDTGQLSKQEESPDLTNAPTALDTDIWIDKPQLANHFRARLTEVSDGKFATGDDRQVAIFNKAGKYVDYTVTAEPFDASKSLSLPIKGPEYAEWLKPSEGIQSDDKDIQALTREIVGSETNAYKALCKLQAWVHTNIKPGPKMTSIPPSATEILKARTGTPAHTAILCIALARAAGIPTRLVIGAHSTGGMFFHYGGWIESYVGTWVDLDPAMENPSVDATYIKFTSGSSLTVGRDLPAFSRSTLDILECK